MLMICGISSVPGSLSMNLPLWGAIHECKVRNLETQEAISTRWDGR